MMLIQVPQRTTLKAKLFRGYSNTSRLTVLEALRARPLTVSAIVWISHNSTSIFQRTSPLTILLLHIIISPYNVMVMCRRTGDVHVLQASTLKAWLFPGISGRLCLSILEVLHEGPLRR